MGGYGGEKTAFPGPTGGIQALYCPDVRNAGERTLLQVPGGNRGRNRKMGNRERQESTGTGVPDCRH